MKVSQKIHPYAQHRLEIIFRFQEERDALEAAYHELEGGEAR